MKKDFPDEERRISWREFLIICGAIYKQVLPGMFLLAGVILVAIALLLYFGG